MHTCGCRKDSEFVQCQMRQGTNVKCSPVTRTQGGISANYCSQHLVKPNAPVTWP
ncbi:hypothetical protein K503DRAFT_777783 [Rhizopogon vinicolor AM-OR11-026]|uniref:Uncharacterized protein n=1 Tax=Rhizopogon vinicolor AM-OR11-026 TaxID=1314800 RepID=A0A1B7MF11_9AGAM|nr:hypothetical protein K503DRAFT_777968 [Rhizopogon vinicolor AM-OR11-026]OAX31180.1 hypothetical protein K503DRAFT_777783 [Rhizopogon vinicolor AM-OR11-026]